MNSEEAPLSSRMVADCPAKCPLSLKSAEGWLRTPWSSSGARVEGVVEWGANPGVVVVEGGANPGAVVEEANSSGVVSGEGANPGVVGAAEQSAAGEGIGEGDGEAGSGAGAERKAMREGEAERIKERDTE